MSALKNEIRVLGIDDGQFVFRSNSQVLVVGVIFRGGLWLEGVISTTITVDGLDATQKINQMIVSSPYYRQLRVILLSGLTFGGFNVVDINELYKKTSIPVIVITQKMPQTESVKQALSNLSNSEIRWQNILNAGEIITLNAKLGKQQIYAELAGITKDAAQKVINLSSTRSNIPEALRVAHLIASGMPYLE
ncbi:MAG: DUF99 family protein [Crenarchaeota archaeon]|nr:DUF99 family protein [Thermoproteota archaeon]